MSTNREAASLSIRDYQLLAAGWDACLNSMRYPDGSPVEIEYSHNPYRDAAEEAK